MPDPSIAELERDIAMVRENINELIEQAAAYSGAGDENRNADRIAQQEQELARLIKLRDDVKPTCDAGVWGCPKKRVSVFWGPSKDAASLHASRRQRSQVYAGCASLPACASSEHEVRDMIGFMESLL
jgi:hypothetical protein